MRGTAWLLLLSALVVGCSSPEQMANPRAGAPPAELLRNPQSAYARAKAEDLGRRAAVRRESHKAEDITASEALLTEPNSQRA